ncbi:hypothetical protein AB0O34_06900 [Sphaerisporangium sp. NPDC088356]|uniref:hypothetical protein n=1 Tax=Sphaerisporangium sp. NPDC088356 TaxID=3154871 RepID=UPI003412359A
MNEAPKHTNDRDDQQLAHTADHGVESDSGTEDMVASQVLWDSSLATSRLDEAISAQDHDQEQSVPEGDPPAHHEERQREEVSRRTDERGQELRRPHRNR